MVTIFNLGCGTKTSPRCINVDWSPYLRIAKNPLARLLAPLLVRGERRQKLRGLPEGIVVHDLRKGVPAADGSADVVYHSHVLEHIDRSDAPAFLADIHRALKPGGIHRVVVPDMEFLARRYLEHLESCDDDPGRAREHDAHLGSIIEQMVRREAFGTSQQRPMRRWVENLLLGDARRRGETHQWMYDRVSLAELLREVGFEDVQQLAFDRSSIPDWDAIALDRNASGDEYMPGSVYVECRTPS